MELEQKLLDLQKHMRALDSYVDSQVPHLHVRIRDLEDQVFVLQNPPRKPSLLVRIRHWLRKKLDARAGVVYAEDSRADQGEPWDLPRGVVKAVHDEVSPTLAVTMWDSIQELRRRKGL